MYKQTWLITAKWRSDTFLGKYTNSWLKVNKQLKNVNKKLDNFFPFIFMHILHFCIDLKDFNRFFFDFFLYWIVCEVIVMRMIYWLVTFDFWNQFIYYILLLYFKIRFWLIKSWIIILKFIFREWNQFRKIRELSWLKILNDKTKYNDLISIPLIMFILSIFRKKNLHKLLRMV